MIILSVKFEWLISVVTIGTRGNELEASLNWFFGVSGLHFRSEMLQFKGKTKELREKHNFHQSHFQLSITKLLPRVHFHNNPPRNPFLPKKIILIRLITHSPIKKGAKNHKINS